MQATDLIVDVYEPEGGSDILISDFDAWTFFVLYIAQVLLDGSTLYFTISMRMRTSWIESAKSDSPTHVEGGDPG